MGALKVVLATAIIVALSGCPLFQDPAAPPAIDRLEATASLEDVFGSMRGNWTEMHVLDNDDREFILIRSQGPDGVEITAAYDSSLNLRNDEILYGRLGLAFPDERGGSFILEQDEYSGVDFGFLQGGVFTNTPTTEGYPFTGIAYGSSVYTLVVPSSGSTLSAGPLYDASWPSPGDGITDSVFIARDPANNTDPLSGFELESSYHRPKDGISGLLLYNEFRDSTYVVELTDDLAAEVAAGLHLNDYLEDLVRVVEIPDFYPDRVAYTDRGIVAFDYNGEHVVYDIETGDELARASFDREEEFEYAYAPDGRHWYVLSLERSRIYRMGAWW